MPALRPLRPSAPLALSAVAALAAIGSATLSGCAASLAQPFDQWKGASITVYRLQNYEPPPAQAGATFTIPPQIQSWIQGAAALLPPGLIPPGLIPGSAPAPAATAQDLRFHGFRVLQWKTVTDPKTHDEILRILGLPLVRAGAGVQLPVALLGGRAHARHGEAHHRRRADHLQPIGARATP
jgi:hypothetical protein